MANPTNLRQMVIWPPATAALIVLAIPGWFMLSQHATVAMLAGYSALAFGLMLWLAPSMGYQLWREGDALY